MQDYVPKLRWDDLHGEYNFGSAGRWVSPFAELEPLASYADEDPMPQHMKDSLAAANMALARMLWEERWTRWANSNTKEARQSCR